VTDANGFEADTWLIFISLMLASNVPFGAWHLFLFL